MVSRESHKLQIGGSIPSFATKTRLHLTVIKVGEWFLAITTNLVRKISLHDLRIGVRKIS